MFSISHEHQMLQCQSKQLALENLWKPHVEIAPNCPRCASSNTKFCYYNNYSFSQPRYFCKACRRYWTKGGSLRNVPVGGGCRKSRRTNKSVRPSSISTSYSSKNLSNDSSNTDEDSTTQTDTTTSGSGIDLAMVYAKFLNQDIVTDGHEPPSDLSMDDQLLEKFSMGVFEENQKVLEQDELLIKEQYDPQPENPSGFGLHGLLMHDDDPVTDQDALWSDATVLPSLGWQPMGQLQAFDQTLSCDNWSCSFDLPNYEVFSMP